MAGHYAREIKSVLEIAKQWEQGEYFLQ